MGKWTIQHRIYAGESCITNIPVIIVYIIYLEKYLVLME